MEPEVVLEYRERPALLPIYARILFSRRAGVRKGGRVPNLCAKWLDAAADPRNLGEYRKACGINKDGLLPLLYPYVLTGGLQLSIVAAPRFPLPFFGMVHQRNRILQHRRIGDMERMNVSCSVGESRVVKQGLEFDIVSEISVDGERVWECVSTYLSRGSYGEAGEPPPGSRLPDLETPSEEANWDVPRGMGRRYARIGGDYNPIHVSSILARFFGFKRAIVHGMWSAACCLQHLPQFKNHGAVRFDVAFKGPIFVGSRVTMKAAQQAGGHRFDLFCEGNPRPCLCGLVRTEEATEPVT
jgi:acyl dehydratase